MKKMVCIKEKKKCTKEENIRVYKSSRSVISTCQSLQYLGVLSTLRSVTNGDHEIHNMCIKFLSMKLSTETAVQVHVRESSDICFIIKVSKTKLSEKLTLVHFPTTEK